MRQFAKQNKGCNYLLTVIDIFSKFAWAIPIKTKTRKQMIESFEKLFKERKPKKYGAMLERNSSIRNSKVSYATMKSNYIKHTMKARL